VQTALLMLNLSSLPPDPLLSEDDHQVSYVSVKAIGLLLENDERKFAVYALLNEQAKAALERPTAHRWYPGRTLEHIFLSIVQVGGEEWLEELSYQRTVQTFGPMLKPVIKSLVSFSHSTPATLFKALDVLSGVALKRIEVEWEPLETNSGNVIMMFPRPLNKQTLGPSIRGIFRYVGDMTKTTIQFGELEQQSSNKFVQFVSW
jgi:hypothetical protein